MAERLASAAASEGPMAGRDSCVIRRSGWQLSFTDRIGTRKLTGSQHFEAFISFAPAVASCRSPGWGRWLFASPQLVC